MTALEIIQKIKERKENSRIFPTHAQFKEILESSEKSEIALKYELNSLVKENKIGFGRTINDIYFYICKN